MMVMMMRWSLDVMVVYWLTWTVLWKTALSSVEWGRCIR
jgi:hypothetical protein